MVGEFIFKNTKAIKIENDEAVIIILPKLGGKIASFYLKSSDFELLDQNQETVYKEARLGDSFELFDTSGFDDCFPNIVESIEFIEGKEVKYPDHGEIWSASFDYEIDQKSRDTLRLEYYSSTFSYIFKKVITLDASTLKIDYEITNIGDTTLHSFYTMHCLTRCEEDMQIWIEDDVEKVVNVTESQYLGEEGTIHSFPLTSDAYGNDYRLDRVFAKEANKFEKYYVLGPVDKGRCGIYYPNKNVTFTMTYNAVVLPYLGFWVTEGGFKNSYNCALEPSSGYYDSMEKCFESGKYDKIYPGASLDFTLKLSLQVK